MNNSVKTGKNIGYQTIYQFLLTALPLITAPYLARTLGAHQQGVYSFTNSITGYFTLFAMLGISNHGVRSIAESNTDFQNRSSTFSSIYSIQLLTSFLSLVCYIGYIIFFRPDNIDIVCIQSLMILACIFDVNWLYFGMEKFRLTVIRNIVVRLSVVIGILIFVNSPEDLSIYAILMSGSYLVSNLVLWITKFKYVKYKIPPIDRIKSQLKDVLVLFVPLFALSIYHIMDKTMLGILSDYENVGYYYNADKIINIPIGIVSGISTVMFPRMVSILKTEEEETKFDKVFSLVLEGTILLSVALGFGIAAISDEFVPVFFGPGFDECVVLIKYLSPVMIIKTISTTLRYQYLIPKKQDTIFVYSVILGAVTNIIANLLFIPHLGALGAVIGTLLAEIAACCFQIIKIKKEYNLIQGLVQGIPYIFIGAIMYCFVRIIGKTFFSDTIILICIEILSGAACFTLLLVLYYWKWTNKSAVRSVVLNVLNKLKK